MKVLMKMALGALAVSLAITGSAALQSNTKAAAAEQDAELFLPTSYEQYLPLDNPADIAVSDDYIAVADGNTVYLYDRVHGGEYREYHHRPNATSPIYISKLQFAEDGRLYLADTAQELFELHLDDLTVGNALLSLSTFYIAGANLYAVTVTPATGTTIYQLSMDRPLTIDDALNSHRLATNPITPSISYTNGTLYCAITGTVYSYSETLEPQSSFMLDKNFASLIETVALCAVEDNIYYTDARGLLRTDTAGNSAIIYSGTDFAALTAHGDHLYCIKKNTVRELLVTEDGTAYTGYELASASDSVNRLSGATESVRAGSLIVTADNGNDRVSVYNTETQEFTVLPCGAASVVATDGNMIAAAVGDRIFLYKKGATQPYYTHTTTSGIVTGVTIVYGRCYYLTAVGYGEAAEGVQEIIRTDAHTSLVSDIFGNLYVAETSNRIVKYSEDNFLNKDATGEIVTDDWSLPADFTSLRADFDGNLYYVSDGNLYQNGALLSPLPGGDLVYRSQDTESAAPVSVALAFEDNGLYVQFGDYMAYTRAIDFPNLSQIPTEEIYKTVFSAPGREELKLVDIAERTVGIQIALGSLEETSEYFETIGYGRSQSGRGVLLGTAGRFSLVAIYKNYAYEISLFLSEECTEAETDWQDVSPATRYLTSEVAFSYYPCLSDPLTMERLPRGTAVKLLAYIFADDGMGFEYAYIETQDGLHGYAPLNYLTEYNFDLVVPENYRLGYLKANEDGVIFHAEDGSTYKTTERTQVKIYDVGDGLYVVRLTRDGVEYSAQVTQNMIEKGNPSAIRISVIIILCVVAIGIVVVYALVVPKKKKR